MTAGFPAAARTALADAQLRRNIGKATTAIRVKRLRAVGELPDWEALRDAGAAIKARAMATLPEQLERLEERVTAAGGTVHWARDGAEANSIVAGIAREHDATEVIKVKSLLSDEIGLNEALELRGINAIETDLAELIIQLGDDEQSHILVPAIHRNRAEIAALFEKHDRPGGEARARAGADRGGGAAAPAGQVPLRADGDQRRELRHRRDRHGRGRRVRGQRPHVHDDAARAGHPDGDREGAARMARPRGHAAAAAALLHGGADEPVHVAVDRRARRRRPAGVPPRPDRRGAHQRAGGRGGPPGAALHPLLGLPERVPGLLARRRARVRVDLSRADRRDPHAAAAGPRPRADAAVGLLAVRGLLRGLPGQDRHPHRARAPARAGRARGQVPLVARAAGDGRARRRVPLTRALRARPAARPARQRAARGAAGPAERLDDDARAARGAVAELPRLVGAASRHRRRRDRSRATRRASRTRERPRRGPRPDPRCARRRRGRGRGAARVPHRGEPGAGGRPRGRRALLRACRRVPRDGPSRRGLRRRGRRAGGLHGARRQAARRAARPRPERPGGRARARRPAALGQGSRRARRRAHRLRARHRRDRDRRARRRRAPAAAGRSAWCPTSTSASCSRPRFTTACPTPSPR